MVYSTDYIMPSNKNIFIPQTIFNVQGVPMLSGVVKSGELKNGMTVDVDNKILKIVKIEGSPTNMGISLSDIDITQAQDLVGKELEFFEKK